MAAEWKLMTGDMKRRAREKDNAIELRMRSDRIGIEHCCEFGGDFSLGLSIVHLDEY